MLFRYNARNIADPAASPGAQGTQQRYRLLPRLPKHQCWNIVCPSRFGCPRLPSGYRARWSFVRSTDHYRGTAEHLFSRDRGNCDRRKFACTMCVSNGANAGDGSTTTANDFRGYPPKLDLVHCEPIWSRILSSTIVRLYPPPNTTDVTPALCSKSRAC